MIDDDTPFGHEDLQVNVVSHTSRNTCLHFCRVVSSLERGGENWFVNESASGFAAIPVQTSNKKREEKTAG